MLAFPYFLKHQLDFFKQLFLHFWLAGWLLPSMPGLSFISWLSDAQTIVHFRVKWYFLHCLQMMSAFSIISGANLVSRTLKNQEMNIATVNLTLQMGNCGKPVSQKGHMRTHISTVHEKIKTSHCDSCDYSFPSNLRLKGHILTVHESEKMFYLWKKMFKRNLT